MPQLYNKVNRQVLKENLENLPEPRKTLSFYAYTRVEDPFAFRDKFYLDLSALEVMGRIYVAYEGINAQISVPESQVEALEKYLRGYEFLEKIRMNFAIEDDGKSFFKLAIKVRGKIVADGLSEVEIDLENRGKHLTASEFNKMLDREDSVVVDMRNHYESEVGHFKEAILPDVETFREALPKVADMLSQHREKPVLMYCTGGIRCEKASAYLLSRGFSEVYQLDGGIIEYARQVEKLGLESKFTGKNFVFDERLGERITSEVISQCHQCGIAADRHINCANDACHLLFIQCDSCAEKFNACCSDKCSDFISLPLEEQKKLRKTEIFNGTRFGKGRYKAARKGEL